MSQPPPRVDPQAQPNAETGPFLFVYFPWLCLTLSFVFITVVYWKQFEQTLGYLCGLREIVARTKDFIERRTKGAYAQVEDGNEEDLGNDLQDDQTTTQFTSQASEDEDDFTLLGEDGMAPNNSASDSDTDILSSPETSILDEGVLEPSSSSLLLSRLVWERNVDDTEDKSIDDAESNTHIFTRSFQSFVEKTVQYFKNQHEMEAPTKPQIPVTDTTE
ncbi:hypothetical protein BJY04DRAFT_216769 [Aspergillus karnatakaensis]|uniref:uncharacterized protein n=1 Tax=Aspergillus karnatakaensis TaxID=1810916 RepID=UPI003CCE3469